MDAQGWLGVTTPRSRWTEGLVWGLGDPLGEARVLDRPLAAWRAGEGVGALPSEVGAASASARLEGPCVLAGEDLWLSPGVVSALLRAAAGQGGVVRLVRPLEGPGGFSDPLGRLPRSADGASVIFDVWALPAGVGVERPRADAALPAALEGAAAVDLPGASRAFDLPLDPETGQRQLKLRAGALAVVPVAHWVEVQRANLLAIAARVLSTPPWRAGLSLVWAMVRAMSLNPFRILQKITRVGRRCQIHPSAVVEGCHLGDGVKIDAGAVLRGCFIGDGVEVGAQAIAEFSVLGAGCRLQRRAMANGCVFYPEARAGGILQLGFMGRRAVTKMFAVGTDMRPGRPVAVTTPDGMREVDAVYQGVCIGHDAFVGSGVWIAPGRVIEAGRQVVRDRSLMVLK